MINWFYPKGEDFQKATHTIVFSDHHLSDAEPPHPKNPLWKRFKRKRYFMDEMIRSLLSQIQSEVPNETIELVLNGDVFDFDSVTKIPKSASFNVNWLEQKRGLLSEEQKSTYKINVILEDHSIFVQALKDFIEAGNHVVFVIGNHDVELHWPSVQQSILDALHLSQEDQNRVRFCEWFYVSNGDTLIEHSNQYDPYCLCSNPIHPLIKKGHKLLVRLPFGNLAGKFMMNGMGLMNPHVESSFIKPFREYVVFFLKYIMRTQPLILWTWFWSAIVTLYYALTDGFLPALRDPLTVEERVENIGYKANSSPKVVRSLRELHVHPSVYNPIQILKELWLDRALLILLILFLSIQFYGFVSVFVTVSIWWFILPIVIFLPPFIFYASSVQPETIKLKKEIENMVPHSAQIAGVKRVIHGHTHNEKHTFISGIEFVNTGTWSPAFHDVECTQPYGKKCFAWIQPHEREKRRVVALYEWDGVRFHVIQPEAHASN